MRKYFVFVAAAGLLLIAWFLTEAKIPASEFALEQTLSELTLISSPAPLPWVSLTVLPIQLFDIATPRFKPAQKISSNSRPRSAGRERYLSGDLIVE
jgi:hypothetical protein